MRLPAVVSVLYKAINRNAGITYVRCTAGLGRAPAVASKRPSFPKLDAIKNATADIVLDDESRNHADLQQRLVGNNPDLTKDERMKIRQFLETFPKDKE